MKNKIREFITNNNLEFNEGSGGDINILALVGYACYINATLEDCCEVVNSKNTTINDEIERIYEYASTHNYKAWWTKPEAKNNINFNIMLTDYLGSEIKVGDIAIRVHAYQHMKEFKKVTIMRIDENRVNKDCVAIKTDGNTNVGWTYANRLVTQDSLKIII